jgi:hypothetical protein
MHPDVLRTLAAQRSRDLGCGDRKPPRVPPLGENLYPTARSSAYGTVVGTDASDETQIGQRVSRRPRAALGKLPAEIDLDRLHLTKTAYVRRRLKAELAR